MGDDSDVYIFGTRAVGGKNVIECCGCRLANSEEGRFAIFDNYGDLLRHVSDHRAAGDSVPQYVDDRIFYEANFGTPGTWNEPWIEVGDLPDPSEMAPNPRAR